MSEINIIDKLTGVEFEIFVKEFLENIGFSNLKTTKASGDFGVDVTGNLNTEKYVIQTKRYNRPVNLKSVQEVYTGMKYYGADLCMVVSNNIFTEAAIELAKSCNCKLVDRDDLEKWLKKDFSSPKMFLEFLQEKKLKKFKIPSEKLVQEYYSLKEKLGKQPTISDIDSKCKFSSSVYRKRWGTWNFFLKAINEPIIQNKSITIKEFENNFKDVKEQIGKTPTTKDMNILGEYSISAYERKYGTWNKFLEGINESLNKKHKISKDDFVNEFSRVKLLLGHVPTTFEMSENGNIAPNSYRRIWGSWSNFLKEQGEKYQKRNIPEADLIRAYLGLKKQLNKESLTQKDMNDFGNYCASVYERRFGSWNKFLKYIGDKENLKTDISKKDLKEEYLRIKNILNKSTLSCSDIRKHSKYALSTYFKRFGSWNSFLKEIG
ncbi:MAG: restriction endonuclease [bacterium]|nr:restriction endonuclease [bacterium]